MATTLSVEEINDLIRTYYKELNKLQFQRQQILGVLAELDARRKAYAPPAMDIDEEEDNFSAPLPAPMEIESAAPEPIAVEPVTEFVKEKKKLGPKGKKEKPLEALKAPKIKLKSGPKRKDAAPEMQDEQPAKRGGRQVGPLNEWDQIVMDIVANTNGAVTRQPIDEAFRAKVEAEKLGWSDNKLYQKTSSVLMKLVETHKKLRKVDIKGRGYGYELA